MGETICAIAISVYNLRIVKPVSTRWSINEATALN